MSDSKPEIAVSGADSTEKESESLPEDSTAPESESLPENSTAPETESLPESSTAPESESLPKETADSAVEAASPSKDEPESAPVPTTESEPASAPESGSQAAPAESQTDETKANNESEQSTSQPEPTTEKTPVDDKVIPQEPLKEEPVEPQVEGNIAELDTVDEGNTAEPERKQSNASDEQEMQQRKKSGETETNDELQNMIKELSEPKVDENFAQHENKLEVAKTTTENLISVLEDGMENQAKEKPAKESAPADTEAAPTVKPPKPKKYLYKLKSKTGKILHYTSTVPITLKRPIIHLTKMVDTSNKPSPTQSVIDSEREDIDSDNSNVKENEAPNNNVMKTVRKKGRPPLSSRPPPPVITLDGNASDTSEDMRNKSAPSFSMQTRKRQLKFLPDGRLITPQKRVKSDDKSQSTSSSDSDIDIISDSEKSDPLSANKPSLPRKQETSTASNTSAAPSVAPNIIATTSLASLGSPKKYKSEVMQPKMVPGEKRTKYKKIFDYESYYREKSGAPSQGLIRTSVGNKSFASNLTPIRKINDTPKLKPILPSNAVTPKKATSVDPAQLLSSLIGVPISSSQLNVVKFKPKIIQERTNTIVASTPKKVTFEDDRNTKYGSANPSELLKSTPFKIVSKPAYQKILPKPAANERTPITQTRMAYQHINIENKLPTPIPSANNLYVTSKQPFLRDTLRDTLAKFETFSDSKVVKTKEGPKKAVKRKLDEDVFLKDNNTKTLYDLMYEIFEKMPSWNLHVVPDTNCFCIAQVSRGRMGIPTLKKSIEINSEFFAKVYVHQLQCKRYDGIYDTESKIVKLIKEIDALAA